MARIGWLIGLVMVIGTVQAQVIPDAYRVVARKYDIPEALLYAIAMQESGVKMVSGQVQPWPWTLNVNGQGLFFLTRADAYQRVLKAIQRKEIFDFGLGQVNWNWNKDMVGRAPIDIWNALEPYANLELSARILSQRYAECRSIAWVKTLCDQHGDWWVAIGRYHSPGKEPARQFRAKQYRDKVKRRWQKLV